MIFAITMLIIPRENVSAQAVRNNYRVEELIEKTIEDTEKCLVEKKTDVITELNKQMEYYEKMLITASPEDCVKIRKIINGTKNLIDEFRLYKARKLFGIQLKGIYHAIWTPAVAAIIAGFQVQGWDLAAELLTYSTINDIYGSHYEPVNGWYIKYATYIRNTIAVSEMVVDEDKFPGPEFWEYIPIPFGLDCYKVDADAFYGIGGFTYRKVYHDDNNVNICIKDLYDYEIKGGYGLAESIIYACYQAQLAGVIVPFYTIINDLIVPGTVPFKYEIEEYRAVITGPGHFLDITIPEYIYKFGHEGIVTIDPQDDNHMPNLDVKIGDFAFENCSNLTSVTLSESKDGYGIFDIGNFAFSGCSSLTSITIPASVKGIGDGAFENCIGLTSITFTPNSQLESIGVNIFNGCDNLTNNSLPSNNFTFYNSYFFYADFDNSSIYIPSLDYEVPLRMIVESGNVILFTGGLFHAQCSTTSLGQIITGERYIHVKGYYYISNYHCYLESEEGNGDFEIIVLPDNNIEGSVTLQKDGYIINLTCSTIPN